MSETTVKDKAYELLKEATTDEALSKLADAVAKAEIPLESINELFVLKALLNSRMYTGYGSLAELVAATPRQGLCRKPGPKTGGREPKRVVKEEADERARGGGKFLSAMAIAKPSCLEVSFVPFESALQRGVSAYKAALKLARPMLTRGRSVEEVVEAVFDKRIASEGDALALIPIDRYLAAAFLEAPYEANAKALGIAATHIATNLKVAAKPGKAVLTKPRLPVSRGFKEAYLSADGDGYSEARVVRNGARVWNDMLTAWAFSMAGRVVDVREESARLIGDLAAVLGGEVGRAFGRVAARSHMTCVLRDGPDVGFGYGTAVFAVCGVANAKELAAPLVRVRDAATKSRGKKIDALSKLLTRELYIHGVSITESVEASEMWRFALPFGCWTL